MIDNHPINQNFRIALNFTFCLGFFSGLFKSEKLNFILKEMLSSVVSPSLFVCFNPTTFPTIFVFAPVSLKIFTYLKKISLV